MRRSWDWVGVPSRLLVGCVWVVAAVLKLPDPSENVRAVRAYQLLPESIVPAVGHGLPVLELLVGACLLLGLFSRGNAVLSSLLLFAFVVGIASAWARGLSIECGCFGGGAGPAQNAAAKYPFELARDVVLLALSVYLVRRPRTPWAADNRLLLT